MMGMNTSVLNEEETPRNINSDDGASYYSPTPHVYSDAVVSAPLITWFGLPTLIKLEQNTAALAPSSEGVILPSSSDQYSSADEFTPLPSNNSVHSASSYSQTTTTQHRRSFFDADDKNEDDTHTINAYTYRVRTRDMDCLIPDDHQLLLSQNPDGTYSYETEHESENDALLLRSSSGHGGNKTSVPLDTVLGLEETLTKMDDGTLPPHIHPSIPTDMLNPEYTYTTPALRMWTLAVLVFYSQFYNVSFLLSWCEYVYVNMSTLKISSPSPQS